MNILKKQAIVIVPYVPISHKGISINIFLGIDHRPFNRNHSSDSQIENEANGTPTGCTKIVMLTRIKSITSYLNREVVVNYVPL